MDIGYHMLAFRHARVKFPHPIGEALVAVLSLDYLFDEDFTIAVARAIVEFPPPSEMFQCPQCLELSTYPSDKDEGYCGACHECTGTADARVTERHSRPDSGETESKELTRAEILGQTFIWMGCECYCTTIIGDQATIVVNNGHYARTKNIPLETVRKAMADQR